MAYVGPAYRYQGVYCHEHWSPVGYPLLRSSYDYMVRDVYVQATLTETYQAQTNIDREISYVFEIPPEASVTGFSAQLGATRVDAIVDEKSEADRKYQQAKNAGIQAWKLDKVNDEVFQISLGKVSSNTTIIVRVTYVHIISSDTLEDSVRLTIPAGLAPRPGAAPASQTTVPTAPSGSNAVTITVGIEADSASQIFGLNCLSHHASITNGFSDGSFKTMSPVAMMSASQPWRSYVEYTSAQFLKSHFVLVWLVPNVDQGRCLVETLNPAIPGKPQTIALALTMVSNISLAVAEHEYIFLVDYSGSMAGARIQTANNVVRKMLDNLPTAKSSTFNIFYFNTTAWSVIPGGRSLGYDISNVDASKGRLTANATGGTDINAALTAVLRQRDASKQRCSIIVITDGLDWGVTAAMQTVQRSAATASDQDTLLRVFVMGLGDDVSRGMCEALARSGAGATAYISESELPGRDHADQKAETLMNAINRAPIRVRSITWGTRNAPNPTTNSGGGITASRPTPNPGDLGPAAKGDNLPSPNSVQQAPLPGTMFWAVRSSWFAIINGTFNPNTRFATVTYDVPGGKPPTRTHTVNYRFSGAGRLIHSLAARALIQTLEDQMVSLTDPTERYWKECEIVRLGKTYSLASTQTSFVATMNGVGTTTTVASGAPMASKSLLAGVPSSNTSNLGFVNANVPAASFPSMNLKMSLSEGQARFQSAPFDDPSLGDPSFDDTSTDAAFETPDSDAAMPSDQGDELSELLAAQDGNGTFDAGVVERVVFPGASIPAIPAFIATLHGRDNIKEQVWIAICVVAFLQGKHADRSDEWETAQSAAEKYVKTTLCCIFGVDSARAERIFSRSLDDAAGYFY